MPKKLPIGIQTFRDIIEGDYIYVDKTPFALKLIESGGKYFFLSRPRRFGKSLFLSTLKEMFEGNRELFKDLYIHDKYDFKPYPVIRISFGSGSYTDVESINDEINYILKTNIRYLNIDCSDIEKPRICFKELIYNAYEKFKEKVVILIDEYDKPILDNILDKEKMEIARDILKNFYSVIKDMDEYIRFSFITGVSKFSKLNLSSGLNNLEDITIDERYAEICGYTQNDLETVFKEYLKDTNMELVKRWYNGYYYFGEKVYNPFDILLFISKGCDFRNYWWNTGNPAFLIEKLKESTYYIPEIENATVAEEQLDAFDVEYIDLLALLWQTGYLTIKERIEDEFGGNSYRLKIPNLEVQLSLNRLFIDYLTNQRYEKLHYRNSIMKAIREGDFDSFVETIKTIFASIPYNNYANNIIANYDGYYSSVFFVYLAAVGYDLIAEDVTNIGRIDLTMKTKDKIIIFEFKVDSKEKPIEQIKEKRYYEKYMKENKPIYLIGINFSSDERNVVEWKVERLGS